MPLLAAWAALLVLAAAVPPLHRRLGRETGHVLTAAFLLLAVAIGLLSPLGPRSEPLEVSWPWLPSLGVTAALRLDGTATLFCLLVLGVGALIMAYCTRYLGAEGDHRTVYALLTLFAFAMTGLVLAADVITLVVFWELTTVCSFFLIGNAGPHAVRPAVKAFVVTAVGGLALLTAVILLALAAGTTELAAMSADRERLLTSPLTAPAGALIALAAFTKSAQFPFHSWLPGAMSAITPVSAYLHAATMVKAGVYLLARFSGVYAGEVAWTVTLVVTGLFTAVFGALWALRQHDLKALLAYSTVSQLGLLVAAIGVGTPAALSAAILHTVAHALFKATLFMLVGIIDREAGSRDIRELSGLRRVMPVTAAMTGLAGLSLAGLPPLLGFVSKETLFEGYLETGGGGWTGIAATSAAALASALTFAYGLRIFHGAFGGPTLQRDLYEPATAFLAPAAVAALAGLALGPGVPLLNSVVTASVRDVVPGAPATHYVFWHGLSPELGVTAAAVLAGSLVFLRQDRVERALRRVPGPHDLYDRSFTGLLRLGALTGGPDRADAAAGFLVRPLAALVVLGGAGLVALGGLPASPGGERARDWPVLALLALTVGALALTRSALIALALAGTTGLVVAVWFLLAGAPDVALTMLLVEVLTMVGAVLVLPRLAPYFRRVRRAAAAGTALLAAAVGLLAALATLAFTGDRALSPTATHYLRHAAEETGGRNAVNTVLVDYRALDTLGEAVVLGAVTLGVLVLLAARAPDPPGASDTPGAPDTPGAEGARDTPGTEGARDAPGAADVRGAPGAEDAPTGRRAADERRDLVFSQANRLLVPVMLLFSAFLLLRGHYDPGGAFAAALIAGVAAALGYLTFRRTPGDRHPLLRPVPLAGAGLLLAVGVGLLPLALGDPLFTPLRGELPLPGGGKLSLTTSLLFDVGVYLLVIGLIVAALDRLGGGRPPGPGTAAKEGSVPMSAA